MESEAKAGSPGCRRRRGEGATSRSREGDMQAHAKHRRVIRRRAGAQPKRCPLGRCWWRSSGPERDGARAKKLSRCEGVRATWSPVTHPERR